MGWDRRDLNQRLIEYALIVRLLVGLPLQIAWPGTYLHIYARPAKPVDKVVHAAAMQARSGGEHRLARSCGARALRSTLEAYPASRQAIINSIIGAAPATAFHPHQSQRFSESPQRWTPPTDNGHRRTRPRHGGQTFSRQISQTCVQHDRSVPAVHAVGYVILNTSSAVLPGRKGRKAWLDVKHGSGWRLHLSALSERAC